MPDDLKVSQIGSSPLPLPFRGLHSPGVRKHCQIILACYFSKLSVTALRTRLPPPTFRHPWLQQLVGVLAVIESALQAYDDVVQRMGEEGQKKGCGHRHMARPCPTTQRTKYRISLTQKQLFDEEQRGEDKVRSDPVKWVILSSTSSCQASHPVKYVILSSESPPQHYHGIRTMGGKNLCQKIRTLLLLSCAYVSCPQNGNWLIHSVTEHPAKFISGQI